MVENMEGFEIDNLIDVLHKVHCDNSRQQYSAERSGRPVPKRISIMPLTPFVYEFFLFNSLYQVNWKASYLEGDLIFHPDEFSESKQQAEFVKFIKNHARKNPADLYRAFEPLSYLPKTVGDWTKVIPDARIKTEDGDRFFKKINELQILLEECDSPENISTTKKTFKLIDEARYYIYLVRNNIFHGAKTLGEVYSTKQKRRIEVYDFFLKGLTSLFFLSVGKTTVASDFVPCPISSQSLPISQDREILDQYTVWNALNSYLMKIGDSRLITQFTKHITPPNEKPSDRSALFYPSSGSDLLTPLLLGLPYCTQFYFFERSQQRRPPPLAHVLKKIPSVKTIGQQRSPKWIRNDNYHYLEFEYDGLPRELFWVHTDNKNFLQKDVELAFYFHRGDSWGEGGSGQKWDSELVPDLMKMIPAGKQCVYLTDGEPGGIDSSIFDSNIELIMPFIERGIKYYCGKLFNK